MSASRPPLSSRPAFLPDEIARREFASAFRGYEPAEVRTFLNQISEQFSELADRVAEMQLQLNDSQNRAEAPELDEETVTRLLGSQTAQILRSAREAANEMRFKAEEEVSASLRDAHEASTRMRTEAETFHDTHIAEAELTAATLRDKSQAKADETLSSATETAERIRAEIAEEQENARIAYEARIANQETQIAEHLETELENARNQGRELIATARAEADALVERTREQQRINLEAILRKRTIAVAQIEELRAGRQRLLEAYKMVRSTLDSVTVELERVEDEARNAAGAAGVAAAQNANIAQEQLDAVIELETYENTDDVPQSVIDLVEGSEKANDDEATKGGGGGAFFDGALAFDDDAGVDLPGTRDANNVATPLDLRDDEEPMRFPSQNTGSSVSNSGTMTQPATDVVVDDFLRTERESGPRLTSSFVIGEPTSGDQAQDQHVTMRRNAAVTKNRPQAVRRLRRSLQDEQDAVIAQLRSGKVSSVDALLGTAEVQATTYQRAVVRLFREVVRAGASSVEGSTGVEPGAVDHAGNDAARYMALELIEDLRTQLVPVLEELIAVRDMPDSGTLQALVGGPYRVVSGDYLEQLVDDRIGGAFDHGVAFAS